MAITLNNRDRFLLPITDGGVTKKYGVIDSRYYSGKHLGIDFGWCDTPYDNVYAIQDGQVVAIYTTSDKGKMVVLYHPYEDGTHRYSCYIHLSSNNVVKLFQQVKQGDVVGKRGNTGSESAGVHLHIYVGKVTKDTIDLSEKVRSANWTKFLNMCDFDPLPYFEKSRNKKYNLAPSQVQWWNNMKYIEDTIESEEEKLKKQLTEKEKEISNLKAEIERLEAIMKSKDLVLKNIANEAQTAL